VPAPFDAVLMIAFGGPERVEDVRPFLANVAQGRSIPPGRLEEVAHHYERIGGRSPLNELTFRQARGLENALKERGYKLPVFVGMRNWHPLLAQTIREMAEAGVTRALGIIMAPHQSESSWQRYQQNVAQALAETGVRLSVDYAPPFYDHPLFIEAAADRTAECLRQLPPADREGTMLIFTAHSIPTEMAEKSPYVEQLTASSRLVAEYLQHERWTIAYQSRSGRPTDPWLEPDIRDLLGDLSRQGIRHVVVVPIGFVVDHVEVLYDLDIEAAQVAKELGLSFLRAKTVNDDARFIAALAEIVEGEIRS